ncbi:MAG: glycosyltransferase family 4 protein [Sulfitobacter sp.]
MTRLMTLLPMACDSVGPSYTCTRLLQGMSRNSLSGPLFVNRVRTPLVGLDYRSSLPGPLAALPYRFVANAASRWTERRYLSAIGDGDIAYLWPAVSLRAYEAIRELGIPIVAEAINTRMEYAREILDAAYAAEGLPPGHGITDARIREENEKLAMTSAIFAPSVSVERSLQDAPVAPENVLPASYGVALEYPRPPRRAVPEAGPTVLFVGYGSIRKGLHQLLRAWAMAGIRGKLVLAGKIEPALKQLCADFLNRADVETLGFVHDVDALYERADIFVLPSFEEGDPLVTYEAAAHGLPIVASSIGAGRIGEETGCVIGVDPFDPETIAAALQQLAGSADDMRDWGYRSRAAVADYDWSQVGGRRADQLAAHLGILDQRPRSSVSRPSAP